MPAYVDVHGEAPGSGAFSGSEGDHSYQAGERYLFAPLNTQSPFVDYGGCGSLTQTYSSELAAYAPPDARAPAAPTISDNVETTVGQYWRLATFVLVLVAAATLVVAVRRGRVKRLARDSRL